MAFAQKSLQIIGGFLLTESDADGAGAGMRLPAVSGRQPRRVPCGERDPPPPCRW